MRARDFVKYVLFAILFAMTASAAHAERRVALVVGNSAYVNTGALPNPQNDAADMGAVLERLGFEVFKGANLKKADMDRVIAAFARAATDAEAALFFYAGHGMQFQGSNYLMPVDAKLEDEVSLTFEMTRVDDVLNAISRARGVKLLILDACRDNPLAQQLQTKATTRSIGPTRGFARIERTQGTMIAFATQANDVAIDGLGSRNSPFTSALLKDIETPNLEVGALFRRVAAEVNRVTSGKQTPELSVSILGEFYFKRTNADDEARQKLARDLEEQQRLAREAADRVRQDNERLLKELAEREQRAKEQLARLAPPPGPAAPAQIPAPAAPAPAAAPVTPTAVTSPPPAQGGLAPIPPLAALTAPSVPAAPPVVVTPPALTGVDLVKSLQAEFKRIGCYAGPVNGAWPAKVAAKALADYRQHAGKPAEPLSAELLASLKSHPDRVCPLTCARGHEARGGVCVAIAAPPGVRPPKVAPAPRAVPPPPIARPRPRFEPRPAPRHFANPRPAPAQPRFAAPPTAPAQGPKRCFHVGGLHERIAPMCE